MKLHAVVKDCDAFVVFLFLKTNKNVVFVKKVIPIISVATLLVSRFFLDESVLDFVFVRRSSLSLSSFRF